MPEKNEKRQKKKGSLVFQIGWIFAVIFVLIIAIFALIQVIGNTTTYMEAKREFLTPILRSTAEQEEQTIRNLEWFMEYWRTHENEISLAGLEDGGLTDDYLKAAELLDREDLTEADLNALSGKEKRLVANAAYGTFCTFLRLSQWKLTNEKLFIFDVQNKTPGYLYALGDELGSLDTHLGEQLWEEGDIPRLIMDYAEGKTTDIVYQREDIRNSNAYYYIGFYPVVKNGKILYVVGIMHDWSEYHSVLIRNLIVLVVITAVLLVAAAAILLHFVNRVAVRPVKKIQNTVRKYQGDKESAEVIESMSRIIQNNELGELASDVSDLVVEIDRYNEENARLIGDRKRVEAELSLAAAIQEGVLPKVFPDEKEYRLFATMTPAKEVGGDFYDFFEIDDTHVGLAIGDVSGKGVPASLYMMITKMLIKQYALFGNNAAEVLKKTNETLCAENKEDMFVTAWFGILDLTTGRITAASAGHEFPIMRDSAGDFKLIKDKHGFVLGGMDISVYKEYELTLEPGATLFLYTDGAPEATNSQNELFGTDRMLETLNTDPKLFPEELCRRMGEAISTFVKDAPQFDDLTMLCVYYNGIS